MEISLKFPQYYFENPTVVRMYILKTYVIECYMYIMLRVASIFIICTYTYLLCSRMFIVLTVAILAQINFQITIQRIHVFFKPIITSGGPEMGE